MSWQEFMLPSFPTRASVNFPAVWISKLDEGGGICRMKFGTEVSGRFCERPRRTSHGERCRFCNLLPWLASSASFFCSKGFVPFALSRTNFKGLNFRGHATGSGFFLLLKNSASQKVPLNTTQTFSWTRMSLIYTGHIWLSKIQTGNHCQEVCQKDSERVPKNISLYQWCPSELENRKE